MITIQNAFLTVEISETGAQLQSVKSRETGLEYLWQGDRTYWGGRAPNLFPFVGRLYEGKFTHDGREYPMKIHGFLGRSPMAVTNRTESSVSFFLRDDPRILEENYPFPFELTLAYRLEGRKLLIRYAVRNTGDEIMYCAFGGHPGFRVPLEEGLTFEDYKLVFTEKCSPRLVEFSPSVLDSGIRRAYPLEGGDTIPLRRELFTFDAVVLQNTCGSVSIRSDRGVHGVTVNYAAMPYVGFWQKPNSDAPFVCIEPWSALPGREGVVEELSRMEDRTAIAPGETCQMPWSVEIF